MKITSRTLICSTVLLLGFSALVMAQAPTPAAVLNNENGNITQKVRMAVLAHNVDNAEALRSIKRLQWAYGHYSELGLWYDFADLFADSGIGHYTQGDLNRDQIRALFYDQVGQGRLGLANGRIYPHISFSPVVDLADDGTHAKGRFRILAMLGGYGGNATWFHGVYENAYVKEQGIWKLNEISNTAQISGSFKTGLSAQSKAPLDVPTFPFHYVPTPPTPFATIGIRGNIDAPAQPLSSLQQRLTHLEDEAAIVNLQHQYGYALDQHDWDKVAALFAEHGSFESGQQGVYIGKASIRKALNQFGPASADVVDDHILFQTYVSVAPDGQSAKARVDQLGLQGTKGKSAEWTQGIYENSFIKENGQWRIQTLHYYPRLITDYAKGWGIDAQAAAGPSAVYPPDAPATEKYGIFPTFYIPAFHFAHPVTGRAPQYPDGDPAIGKAVGFAAPAQSATASTQPPPSVTAIAAAELQTQQALATDAIENLINSYAYYLDECMPAQAATLFASEGVNEIPGIGYYRGAERIASALQQAYCPAGRQEKVLTLHHAVQPLITVSEDGKRANVRSRLWQVHVAGKADDYYLMGMLDGEAIKESGQWKLASLSTTYQWVAAVKDGWSHAMENEALGYAAPLSMVARFPPDQPARTARLAPYP